MGKKAKVWGSKSIILVIGLIILFYVSRIIADMSTPQPLQGKWAEVLKASPDELTKYAAEHPLHLRNVYLEHYSLSKSRFEDLRFENVVWNDGFAQDAQFINSSFIGGSIIDTSFAGSRLVNVVFDGVNMDMAEFVGAELINVTFRNCKIYNSEIRNLVNSTVVIEGGEIFDTNFFDSRVNMTFRGVKVKRRAYMTDLAEGSTVLIEDSHIGPYSDFSRSKLASFTVRNSQIDNSRANGITARKVALDRVKSEFAIAGSTLQEVTIREISGTFSLGRTRAHRVSIEGCIEDSEIYLNQFSGESVSVRNCRASELVLHDATIKDLVLSNAVIGWLDLESFKVDTLSLHNVLIERKLTAPNAMAKEVLNQDWQKQPNAVIEAAGSNIPLP